ncbi:hypothetical protein FOZ62_022040, partial [Perkinsus olseni]
ERGPSMVYDMEMVPLNVSNPPQLSELLLGVLEAGRSQFWPLVWLSKFCLPGQAALMALCAWKRALEGDIEGVLNYMAMGAELIQYGMSCMLEHSREDLPLNATVLSDVLQGRVPLSLQGIVIDPGQGEEYADTAYRACIPLQVEGCWPWIAWTTHESCEMCCDPDIEEKPTACGRDLRRCCNLGEEARVQQPTSPIRLLHDTAPPWDELQRLRTGLRNWRQVGCLWPRLAQMYTHNRTEEELQEAEAAEWKKARELGVVSEHHDVRTAASPERIAEWWEMPESHQRVFPQEDVWAIKGPVCFDLQSAQWATELDIADGIEVADALHGVCGEGLSVAESGSCSLDGSLIPNLHGSDYAAVERSAFDGYSLTLMKTRQAPPPANETLHRHSVAVLMGQLSSNIWHFAQDYVWLWKLIQLGVLDGSVLGSAHSEDPRWWLVETKYAAAECEVDGKRCWHSDGGIPGPKDLWQLMLHKLVLSTNSVAQTAKFSQTYTEGKELQKKGIRHVCYDGAIQPWRAWPSGKEFYGSLRQTVIKACGLHDSGMTRKVVLLERGSRHRRWSTQTAAEMTDLIADWGRLNAFTVGWVRPGGLDPCNQVATLADAAVVIGIGGADMANILWVPEGAILIEVDAGCYLTTSAIAEDGSSYRSHVCRNGQSGVRKQHCHPSAQPYPWRGPGLDYKGEHYERAKRLYDEAITSGRCMDPSEAPPPEGTFSADGYRAEFARMKGLAYSAIHSWLQGDISIDVKNTLLPLLNTLVHEYLLHAFELE